MARKETRTGGRVATDAIIPGRYALSIGMPLKAAPRGFKWRMLTEIARLESGHTPSRSHPEYWDGEIPWVGIRDATANHGRKISTTNQCVTLLGVDNSSARLLPAETVCLSRTASVGYTIIMGAPMATSQDFINWVCGPELSPSYLRYLLMLEQESIRNFSYGTTHQTLYYPDAKAMHVCIPSRAEQDRIAEVLEALDDKIAANTSVARTSRELTLGLFEQVARAAVDSAALDNLARVIRGVSYRSSDLAESHNALVSLKSITRNGEYTETGLKSYAGPYTSEQVVLPDDIALAQTDLTQAAEIVGRVVRVRDSPNYSDLIASLDIAIIRSTGPASNDYLFGALSNDRFRAFCQSRTSGTTVLHLDLKSIARYEVPLPSIEEQARYARSVRPIYRFIDSAMRQNGKLANLRDTLLPHLMSGRLRVKDAEKQVEAVV